MIADWGNYVIVNPSRWGNYLIADNRQDLLRDQGRGLILASEAALTSGNYLVSVSAASRYWVVFHGPWTAQTAYGRPRELS